MSSKKKESPMEKKPEALKDARTQAILFQQDFERQMRDTRRRMNPASGHIYESMMGLRYKGDA